MDVFEERNALKVEVASLREALATGERERDKLRDLLADDLSKVAERIGLAVERLGIGTAADCRADDPNRGYLTAIEDLHDAAASARAVVARLAAAVGFPADTSAEEVVAKVKEHKWMVSAICTELFCHQEMPVPDAITLQRIDGITRRREPGPFDEALFEKETEIAPPSNVRERLEAIQAARRLLATERIAVHRDGFKYIISATTHECLGDWDLVGSTGKRLGSAWVRLNGKIVTAPDFKGENEARDWVFQKLEDDGWALHHGFLDASDR